MDERQTNERTDKQTDEHSAWSKSKRKALMPIHKNLRISIS